MHERSTTGRRHPITYLVEAADDIVYCVVDIEDGLKKRLLTWPRVLKFLQDPCSSSPVFKEVIEGANKQMKGVPEESELWASEYPQAFRVNAISAMVRAVVDVFDLRYDDIMLGDYHNELVRDEEVCCIMFCCGTAKTSFERVFSVLKASSA